MKKQHITILISIIFIISISIFYMENSLLLTDYIAPSPLSIFSGIGLLIILYNHAKR